MSKSDIETVGDKREANVVIELCWHEPISFEVLDANSDDVLEAVERHAGDVALGPSVSLRMSDFAILLRFDTIAASESQAYAAVSKVVRAIEEHTDLEFTKSRGEVEVGGRGESVVPC